jgi:hypothetical protein
VLSFAYDVAAHSTLRDTNMSDPVTPEPTANNPKPPDAPKPGQTAMTSEYPASSQPEYEFTEGQNTVLNDLSKGMLWVRVPLYIVGLFQALIAVGLAFRLHRDGAHIVGIMGHGLAAIICFLLASWLFRAASAFIRVTTTTGHDITNLMTGIRNLAVWFDLLAFFVKLYLVLLGIVLIIMLIGLFTGAFRGPAGV